MIKSLLAAIAFSALAVSAEAPAPCDPGSADRRGCCSHHNGVCGCDRSTNMLRCCDGTNSPTCSCDRAD